MTFSYGATTLPVTAPSLVEAYTEPVGDPGLGVFLAFAKAVLEYEVGAAWEEVAPGEPLIRHARPHDPREEDFGTTSLPTLFAYRGDGKLSRWSDGYWVEERPIALLWVYPPAQAEKMPGRRGVPVAIGRALHEALGPLNGRHPAWVVTGDTDPDAAAYGSDVLAHGGFQRLEVVAVRHAEITVGQAKYDAVTVDVEAREVLTQTVTFSGASAITIRRDSAEMTAPEPFDQTIDIVRAFEGDFSAEFY